MSQRPSTGSSEPTTSNTPARSIEKAQVGAGTAAEKDLESANTDVVDWDGPDDPENPQNWYVAWLSLNMELADKQCYRSARKKWLNIGSLAAITFFSPLASSVFAPGVPRAQAEFGDHDETKATFVVSVFLLGYVA
jgi:hypothetical protein